MSFDSEVVFLTDVDLLLPFGFLMEYIETSNEKNEDFDSLVIRLQ